MFAHLSLLLALRAAPDVLHVSPRPLPSIDPSRQFRTISAAAADAAKPGTRVVIHTGVYRESVVVKAGGTATAPITFEAAQGARVVVTGADQITDWRREEEPEPGSRVYSTPWPYRFIDWNPTHTHPDDDYHLLIGRAEQVFVAGYPLRQVLRRDALSRGTFFADLENRRLFVWAADNREIKPGESGQIEASTRNVLWDCQGAHVRLQGIQFRYAANPAQEGAVQLHGVGDVVEDCRFEQTNGDGAAFLAPDQQAIRCIFRENGQLGWSADYAHRFRMIGCLTEGNNVKGFDRGWEAGGMKIVLSRGVVIDRSRFTRNRGCGVWFDIGNENADVRNCLIDANEDAGIFYEISFGLHAHDNVIVGNGFADTSGAWGAAAGICLSSSPGCLVERNLLVGNKEGFDFREQARTTLRIDAARGAKEQPVWNHDETIRNNILAYNRDAQTWGWFDVSDDRAWPGRSRPWMLESLHLSMMDNLYTVDPGQGLFRWGAAWKKHRYYDDLANVRKELGLEQDSRLIPLHFANVAALDLRLLPGDVALARGCYPRGPVPGVMLGEISH